MFPIEKLNNFSKTIFDLGMEYFCSISRKAIILTADIQVVFRGLKFEPDAESGQKGPFRIENQVM